MSKMTATAKRFGGFMKRNAMYFMILLTIASVATVIALAATGNFGGEVTPTVSTPDNTDNEPVLKPDGNEGDQADTPVVKPDDTTPTVEPLTFTAPCNGSSNLDYSETALAWNATLGQFSTHLGMDFAPEDGKVFSVADGTVKETGYDTLNGYYVVVSHAENYESRYYSLAETLNVKQGDTVTKGQQIGATSTSMAKESLDGNHLHFEMSKNGSDINPLSVIVMNDK